MQRTCWHLRRTLLALYLALLVFLPHICGAQENVTIDDQFGDPTTNQFIQYNPPQAWSAGQDCEPCTAKPRPIRNAHNGTWMDTTFFPAGDGTNGVSGQIVTASVPFIGTAVYVQAILTGSRQAPDGHTDLTFIIDNSTAGVFQRAPDGNLSYLFNQTVFSETGLSNSLHTLTIECGRSGSKSLFLLDSVIYTKETTNSSESLGNSTNDGNSGSGSKTNIAVIVGPVVGGVVVTGAAIAVLFFLRRRRQRGQHVSVLLDSPPMEPVRAAPPGSIDPDFPAAPINPFMSTSSHMTYSHSNHSRVDASSMHGTFVPAATPPSELALGQPGSSSSQYIQPGHSSGNYGEVDSSAIDETMPFGASLPSPPAYSEINPSGSSDTSVLPNPYREGAMRLAS